MSMVPKIYIEFVAEGADGVTDAIGDVSDGLGDVTESGAKAAKALEGTAKAADKAQTRGQKLWGTLKANAGAASGAAGGFAAVSAILNSDMSPAAKLATGVSQGLNTILSAFGPVGQLAGAGISFLSSTLIPLIDGMKTAEEKSKSLADQWQALGQQSSFVAQTLGRMIFELNAASEASVAFKKTNDAMIASLGVQAELIPEPFRIAGRSLADLADKQEQAIRQAQAALDDYARSGEQVNKVFGGLAAEALQVNRARLEAAQTALRATQDSQKKLKEAYEATNKEAEKAPEKKPGGQSKAAAAAMTDHEAYLKVNALRLAAAAAAEAKVGEITDYFAARRQAAAEARSAESLDLLARQEAAEAQIISLQDEKRKKAAEAMAADQAATFGRFREMAGAFGEQMAQAAAASLLFGDSFSEAAAGALKALAVQAGGEALMEGARALAALASWFSTPWNAGLLASAKTHGLAAAGFAAIAGGAAVGAKALGGGAAAAGGGSAPREPTGREIGAPSRTAASGGPTTVNVNFVAGGPLSRVVARETQLGNDVLRRRAG